MRKIFLLLCLPLFLLLGACTTLDRDQEKPKVDLVGITKTDSDSDALQFTIRLRILNPNATPIKLGGLYYELSLDGLEVITGTANNLPTIEGYSDAVVSVRSAAGLINSVRLASRLMESSGNKLPYSLRVKLGSSSRWLPATTITETGTIPIR
ncbi:hypothetical protein DDZ13_06380 [Coraliomargarita sinensis]|uniref:Water stress and hypersensitive response domain-containing protein n=1 Tax=Coraliomargarita sinensis TaxID=2174842 RepID=A0A317ZH61_9BACT|nr:LEA type 2 family protein [Coraliomargarita sinensis]PXA04790.1 hypothetical protein DDZ13_06380 [Coraliomargarita sinensis]